MQFSPRFVTSVCDRSKCQYPARGVTTIAGMSWQSLQLSARATFSAAGEVTGRVTVFAVLETPAATCPTKVGDPRKAPSIPFFSLIPPNFVASQLVADEI
jgi:hypothetical protein